MLTQLVTLTGGCRAVGHDCTKSQLPTATYTVPESEVVVQVGDKKIAKTFTVNAYKSTYQVRVSWPTDLKGQQVSQSKAERQYKIAPPGMQPELESMYIAGTHSSCIYKVGTEEISISNSSLKCQAPFAGLSGARAARTAL